MANREHLEILGRGVPFWNAWRRSNPRTTPDLSRAMLSNTRGASSKSAVEPADLSGIDLSRAQLRYARMRGANLRLASLKGANLKGADLRRADLSGADLEMASLHFANLTLAVLREANLEGAMFWETVLARTNLHGAKGLETCRHGGPSIIDHRTLRKSGTLPLEFLRGCGLPDPLIAFLPSLFSAPYEAQSCFISYSSADEEFAQKLHGDFQSRGIRCWFAPHDMRGGKKVHEQIRESIQTSDRLLLILSENSMNSDWVKTEIALAREQELRGRRRILFHEYGRALARLTRDLGADTPEGLEKRAT